MANENNTERIVPNSFFFGETTKISQTNEQAFGVVSENVFRLTSKFTCINDSKAFAICTGIVFIQPQTGTDKVNLVLKPYNQPIAGLNIKYFIYRGLKKEDFFTSDNKVLAASSSTSDFINSINENFKTFHEKENPLPDFLSSYIGYNPTKQTDTNTLIDDFFYHITETTLDTNGNPVENQDDAFELPLIQQGKSLGHFANGECGIDIVLDYGTYKPAANSGEFIFNLAYARANEAKIDVTSISNAVEKKRIKEQISQFLDVAAYLGLHHAPNGNITINNAGTIEKKTGDAIYTSILQSFATKNNIYIYIQSDRTRSYNFYENYNLAENSTNSLQLGTDEQNVSEITYGTLGWPLLINNTVQTHANERNQLVFKFKTDGNAETILYGQVGHIENATKNNFFTAESLVENDANGLPLSLTKPVILSFPATGASGTKNNVANFAILIYQGVKYSFLVGQEPDENGVLQNVYAKPNFFDDVFDLVNASSVIKNTSTDTYSLLTSQKNKLIHFTDLNKTIGISSVQTIFVSDTINTGEDSEPLFSRVQYVSESTDVFTNVITEQNGISSNTKTSHSTLKIENSTFQLEEPYYYELNLFTDGTQTISGVTIKSNDASKPSKIIVGMSKVENELLKTVITQSQIINARLFLIDLYDNNIGLTSSEGISYQKYNMALVGEDNNGELKLFKPLTDVVIYSIDRIFHFSKKYSDHIDLNNDMNLVMDLKDSF
jgi:hypothetical protein